MSTPTNMVLLLKSNWPCVRNLLSLNRLCQNKGLLLLTPTYYSPICALFILGSSSSSSSSNII